MFVYHPYRQAYYITGINYIELFHNKSGGGKNKLKPEFDFHVKYDKTNREYTVFIGDRQCCVLVSIDKQNPEKKAVLQIFHYYPTCSITKDLEKGSGTRRMMRETFRFIKKKFGIKRVILTDKSYILCDSLKETDIENDYASLNLYKLYLFTHGKPYYVYNFGFRYGSGNSEDDNVDNRKIIKKIKIDDKLIDDLQEKFKKAKISDEKQKWFFSKLKKTDNIREFIKKYNNKNRCDLFFILLERLFLLHRIQDLTGRVYYKDI